MQSISNNSLITIRQKQERLIKARQLEADGCYQEANRLYSNSVDITPDFYIPLIQELIRLNVSYIIAPYEADVQLAFLSLHHYVDLVITVDSDSLAYGCSKVLFKLDPTGLGDEICYDSIFQSALPIRSFSREMFLYLCILSGCDYLSNPPNLGMKRLCPIIEKGKTPDRILQFLQLEGGIEITQE